MCVLASQKPMQACSDLPPPPGLLGDDSLGERARFGEEPPPVANCWGNGSDMGESAGRAGSGLADAAGAVGSGKVGTAGAVPPPPVLAADAAAAKAAALVVAVLTGLLVAARLPDAVVPVAVVPAAAATPGAVPPIAAAPTAVAAMPPGAAAPPVARAANGVAIAFPVLGARSMLPAGAERPMECMPEPWEPPRASALATDDNRIRAMAGRTCSLGVSMLTP